MDKKSSNPYRQLILDAVRPDFNAIGFDMVMGIEGKTKDTEKAKENMKKLCRRLELEKDEATGKFSKASYTLDKESKQVLCE